MIRRPPTGTPATGNAGSAGSAGTTETQRRGADGIKEDLSRQLTLMANRAASYRRLVQHLLQILEDRVHGRAVLASMQRAWKSREFRAYYSGLWTTLALRPKVVGRFGLDERPLDATRADDARWLHASERIEILRRDAVVAAAFVRTATASAPPNTLTIVFQTMMSGYLDATSRTAFHDGLHQLVIGSPQGSVLWADLEVTGPPTSPKPAELWVHARAGAERASFLLGTSSYHPAEVSVREEAVRDLTQLMKPT